MRTQDVEEDDPREDLRLLQRVTLDAAEPRDVAALSSTQLHKYLPLLGQLAARASTVATLRVVDDDDDSDAGAAAAAVAAEASVSPMAVPKFCSDYYSPQNEPSRTQPREFEFVVVEGAAASAAGTRTGTGTAAKPAAPAAAVENAQFLENSARRQWERYLSAAVWCNRQVVHLSQFGLWLSRCGLLSQEAVSLGALEEVAAQYPENERLQRRLGKARQLCDSNDFMLRQLEKLAGNETRGYYRDLRDTLTYDPLFGNTDKVKRIELVKVFNSQAKPCLMKLCYGNSPDMKFIFKVGDDLRRDLLVQVMFHMFNAVWGCSRLELKPVAFTYYVVPISHDRGLIEFVQNSVPLTNFQWDTLSTLDDNDLDHFIATAAGGYISAYLMGVRDRHRDNMMIKDGRTFFHIDFGYVFNFKPWFDANRFAIPLEFKEKLDQRNVWKKYARNYTSTRAITTTGSATRA
eukprot:TRINITY_DN4095_c0_g1_i2.p1 TRINITY_DN4095_c0_g1~~TRINITY_DN4095_c0_g1_i2.p1  ORF type:complete len:501 (-),score=172.73 TRINITY_DN4095_c0_g1_i2:408-1790(-)